MKESLVKTLEAAILAWTCWNFVRMFVLSVFRLSSNMGHVWSKTKSLCQVVGQSCFNTIKPHFLLEQLETLLEGFSSWYTGQVRTLVMLSQHLGHLVKFKENLVNTLEAVFLTLSCWNFTRIFILMISRLSSNIVRSKTRSLGQYWEKSC